VTPAAERLLQQESWPGNVRELKNVIERACILTENKILSERDLMSALASTHAASPQPARPPMPDPASKSGDDPNAFSTAQRAHIERVLRQVGGNKSAAAKLLGLSRRSLYRWLDRLDVKD
jgi:two-component system response regulator AtoC